MLKKWYAKNHSLVTAVATAVTALVTAFVADLEAAAVAWWSIGVAAAASILGKLAQRAEDAKPPATGTDSKPA